MKFCRYYLKLYQKLRELDRVKTNGVKFSKAFSEFTVLVYHNIFGANSPLGKYQPPSTKSTARRKKDEAVSSSTSRSPPAKARTNHVAFSAIPA